MGFERLPRGVGDIAEALLVAVVQDPIGLEFLRAQVEADEDMQTHRYLNLAMAGVAVEVGEAVRHRPEINLIRRRLDEIDRASGHIREPSHGRTST